MLKIDKNEIIWPIWSSLVLAIAIFLLNIIAKVLFLDSPDIGMDEPFTLFRVQKNYIELITDLAQNNHPPLFESIMWLWLRVVGYKAVLLRIVPLTFSALAAVALFNLGRRHFSIFTGIIAALLFTFSDYHFYLSHEIRSYPLFALLTILSFHFYLKLLNIQAKHKKGKYADKSQKVVSTNWNNLKTDSAFWALLLVNALLLYTHYFSATIIAAQVFHALLLPKEKDVKKKMALNALFTALAYLPQVFMVMSRWAKKVEGGHWLKAPGPEELFNVLGKFFNAPVFAVFALLLIGVCVFYSVKKGDFQKLSALLLLFPGVFIGMWILAQKISVFQDRYISFTLIGAFVLVAYALDKIPKKVGIIASVVLIIGMAVTTKYNPVNRQWVPEMAALVKKEKTPKTKVFIYPNWSLQCFSYHYNLSFFKDYQHATNLLANDGIYFGYKERVADFISNSKEIEKFIIINFEGSIAELAKEYGHLNPILIEKDRHGIMVLEIKD